MTTICQTWQCDRSAITTVTIERPCGHPVSLNSSGERSHVQDGTPVQRVQVQAMCRDHALERAGRHAPGPSTCPVCGVREPVFTQPFVHATATPFGPRLCADERPWGPGETCMCYPSASAWATCPLCIEWLHA